MVEEPWDFGIDGVLQRARVDNSEQRTYVNTPGWIFHERDQWSGVQHQFRSILQVSKSRNPDASDSLVLHRWRDIWRGWRQAGQTRRVLGDAVEFREVRQLWEACWELGRERVCDTVLVWWGGERSFGEDTDFEDSVEEIQHHVSCRLQTRGKTPLNNPLGTGLLNPQTYLYMEQVVSRILCYTYMAHGLGENWRVGGWGGVRPPWSSGRSPVKKCQNGSGVSFGQFTVK